jgi:hypothetical protein
MWSPAPQTAVISACSAAIPLPNAVPWPPSSSPSASSSARRVGFAAREYSYSPTNSPGAGCTYVEVWWIAGTIDP